MESSVRSIFAEPLQMVFKVDGEARPRELRVPCTDGQTRVWRWETPEAMASARLGALETLRRRRFAETPTVFELVAALERAPDDVVTTRA